MNLFKPYFSEWLVRQYFRGLWLLAVVVMGVGVGYALLFVVGETVEHFTP